MVSLQSQLVLEEDDRAELGRVVFNVEPILFTLDNGVAPTHTDIVDSNLTLVSSSQLELSLLVRNRQQMDVSRCVLVQRHRLQQYVVALGLRGNLIDQIDNLVDGHTDLEGVWVHLLANFTFETLPVEGSDVHVGGTGWLLLLLSENPTF